MTPALTVVIPAFNEAERLPRYLPCAKSYLDQAYSKRYEIVVVDDGSRDGCVEKLARDSWHWPQLRCSHLTTHRGKGAAVRQGVLLARSDLVLLTDADGATPIEEERKLSAAICGDSDLAVGVRQNTSGAAPLRRNRCRQWGGQLFSAAARLLLALPCRDTQCGFKMFRRHAAQRLFRLSREDGYLIDVEILAWAQHFGYRINEVPVAWSEVPGSKVRLLTDGARMLGGLWNLRRRLARLGAAAGGGLRPVSS